MSERDEARAALAAKAPIDPRREVGAVVAHHGLHYIAVIAGEGGNCQRRLDGPGTYSTAQPTMDADRFVRWADAAECARHGIPYIDRAPKPDLAELRAAVVNAEVLQWSAARARPFVAADHDAAIEQYDWAASALAAALVASRDPQGGPR